MNDYPRDRIVHAYFGAMKRFCSALTRHRRSQVLALAERLAARLAEQGAPRFWWSE